MGSILQLVAYGVEDLYFKGDPEITFFKSAFRRYSNFAIQQISLNIEKGFGKKTSTKFTIQCDLISKPTLHIKLSNYRPNNKFAYINKLGFALIKSIEFKIGGSTINKLTGDYLNAWYELAKNKNYDKMIGNVPELTNYNEFVKPEYDLYIPLDFWFSEYSSAFPVCAIKYQNITLDIELENIENLVCRNEKTSLKDIKMDYMEIIFDCIYLDNLERNKYLENKNSYLIEKIVYQDFKDKYLDKYKIKLQSKLASKELIWFNKKNNNETYIGYTDNFDEISSQHLKNSLCVSEDKPNIGCWVRIDIKSEKKLNNILIYNYSEDTVWFNYDSLIYDKNSLSDKITASIIISDNIMIHIDNTEICYEDINIPVKKYIDTRLKNEDVIVNQMNYGYYMDGTVNPILFSKLSINNEPRINKRNGGFFNYLQPLLYHSCTPCDGINVYPFCLYPEMWQPSGVCDFGLVDNAYLTLYGNLDNIMIINKGYDVLEIHNGLAKLKY